MQYPTIAQPQFAFAPTFAGGGMTNAAQAVQSQGRGNDTMLVHMTPGEVKGLQALAMAHGGSLTINPATGLPEAGFLDAILPIVAGFALGPAGFALMSAPMAALTVGGVTALSTGDLGKGLMAGLGAFGGANLGAALSSTGTEAAKLSMLPEGGMSVAESIPASMGGTGATTGSTLADITGKAASASGPMSIAPGTTSLGSQLGFSSAPVAMTPSQVAALQSTAPTGFSSVGTGIKDLASTGGLSRFGNAFMTASGGGMGTAAGAYGLAAPIMEAVQPSYEFPSVATATESNYAGPYVPTPRDVRFKPEDDTSTSEFTYFTPSNPVPGFQPMYAAQGGYMQRYQDGGEVMPRVSNTIRSAPEVIQTLPAVPESANQGMTASLFGKNFIGAEPANLTEQSGMESMVRYQEGGNVEDRAVRMPTDLSRVGTAPEFNYNFRPIEVVAPPQPAEVQPAGMGGMFSRVMRDIFDREPQSNYTDLSKYKYDPNTQRMVPMAQGGLAALNAFNKGGTPTGGRFLQGAGDGTSDSIPATIGGTQPARLADGEFVVDARTVSEIGNGSSKAGAKKLYAMMERVHSARKKAKRGQDSKADRYLPA